MVKTDDYDPLIQIVLKIFSRADDCRRENNALRSICVSRVYPLQRFADR